MGYMKTDGQAEEKKLICTFTEGEGRKIHLLRIWFSNRSISADYSQLLSRRMELRIGEAATRR